MIPAGTPYTEAEDAEIVRLMRDGLNLIQISPLLKRTERSVRARVAILRREGILPRLTATPTCTLPPDKVVTMTPPLVLANDDKLVESCIRAGGFPRAVVVNGATYWLNHENSFWRAAA